MRLSSVIGLVCLGLLTGASSCSRSPSGPLDPGVVTPAPVLDTGWRQTGWRTPGMPDAGALTAGAGLVVAEEASEDSSGRVWLYRPGTPWRRLVFPALHRTRTLHSVFSLHDTFYIADLGRKYWTWNPKTDSFSTWSIPGKQTHPDSSWIGGFGSYKGHLVASVHTVNQVCEVWIRVDGLWRPFGSIKEMTIGVDVFYEASDGTLFGGSSSGLNYLGSDSVWTEIKPLMACALPSCEITGVTGIAEYDGKGWVTTQGTFVAQFDIASRTYIDTMNTYRVVADSVYKLPVGFGWFFGMLQHGDYLFVPGAEYAPGVWVWNRKRQWFQHVPLLRKGVKYVTNNYASTYGLAVLDDTLYASNSHGIVKFALADIAADLARDTLPWPDALR